MNRMTMGFEELRTRRRRIRYHRVMYLILTLEDPYQPYQGTHDTNYASMRQYFLHGTDVGDAPIVRIERFGEDVRYRRRLAFISTWTRSFSAQRMYVDKILRRAAHVGKKTNWHSQGF